jgi:hypothetical protein
MALMVNPRYLSNIKPIADKWLLLAINILQTHRDKLGIEKHEQALKDIATKIEYDQKEQQLKAYNNTKEDEKKFFNDAEFISYMMHLVEKERMFIFDRLLELAYACEMCAEEEYRDQLKKRDKIARDVLEMLNEQQHARIIQAFKEFIQLEKQKLNEVIGRIDKEIRWLDAQIDSYVAIIDRLKNQIPKDVIDYFSSFRIAGLPSRDQEEIDLMRKQIIAAATQLREKMDDKQLRPALQDNVLNLMRSFEKKVKQVASDRPEVLADMKAAYTKMDIPGKTQLLNNIETRAEEARAQRGHLTNIKNTAKANLARFERAEQQQNFSYQEMNYIISGSRNARNDPDLKAIHDQALAFIQNNQTGLARLKHTNADLAAQIDNLYQSEVDTVVHVETRELELLALDQKAVKKEREIEVERQEVKEEKQELVLEHKAYKKEIEKFHEEASLDSRARSSDFSVTLPASNKEEDDPDKYSNDPPGFGF